MNVVRKRSQILNACLGNLFEHYDTALFSFLSPFLAPLIFPKEEPITALILTYAIIPLGMLVRPFGSLVFGYIGDVYGRGRALFFTLFGMGLVSGCIALSPTYAQVGILAPVFFFFGRLLQNFLAAGETMGGAIFLLENAPQKRRDLLSGFYGSSTIGGALLASFGVFTLSYFNVIDSGWRFLYFAGCITALFGCLMRRAPVETKEASHLKKDLWEHKKPLFCIAVAAGFSYATYSIALVLMNGFIPLIAPFSKSKLMQINTYLLVFDFFTLPFFGWVSSKISKERLMFLASTGVVLLAIPLTWVLEGGSLASIVGVRIAFVVLGVAFAAPFHAWAQELVPAHCRYAVISLGYALGSQLFGGPTAVLSLWLFKKTGVVSSICWYWVALAAGSVYVLSLARKKRLSNA